MIDEVQGRRVLKKAFEDAGYRIEEDYPFRVAGSVISLDGYDPVRRSGYEYITTAAGDRGDLNEVVLEELNQMNEDGLVNILLVDEHLVSSEEELREACQGYLEVLERE
ncbi:MAG: hypothetical protein KC800_19745 [Candidatus Eremiobacteraeota bacterium]|nr:hypothetical protein [Candidatus Eremiobacteraeota bacterium]